MEVGNDFENEVLVRLSVIEEKLTAMEQSKNQTQENATNIMLIDKRITDIETKIKAITTAVVTIITSVVIAGVCYLLKF